MTNCVLPESAVFAGSVQVSLPLATHDDGAPVLFQQKPGLDDQGIPLDHRALHRLTDASRRLNVLFGFLAQIEQKLGLRHPDMPEGAIIRIAHPSRFCRDQFQVLKSDRGIFNKQRIPGGIDVIEVCIQRLFLNRPGLLSR